MKPQLNYMEVAKYLFNNTSYMNNLKLQKMMFFAYIKYYKKFKKQLL